MWSYWLVSLHYFLNFVSLVNELGALFSCHCKCSISTSVLRFLFPIKLNTCRVWMFIFLLQSEQLRLSQTIFLFLGCFLKSSVCAHENICLECLGNFVIINLCSAYLVFPWPNWECWCTSLKCVSRGDFGRLGHGNSSDLFIPQPIKALKGLGILQIACGDSHCLAITGNGEVHRYFHFHVSPCFLTFPLQSPSFVVFTTHTRLSPAGSQLICYGKELSWNMVLFVIVPSW